MNIKPLEDRVVVKAVEAEEKTKAGIFLTASAQEAAGCGCGRGWSRGAQR